MFFNAHAGVRDTLNICNNFTLLAAEILRDIAEREMWFRTRYANPTDFMRCSYQKKIIKEILDAGDHAEEKNERLLG